MTALRHFDAVLNPTKQKVLDEEKWLDDAGIADQGTILQQVSEHAFYKTSPFTVRDLTARRRRRTRQARPPTAS